MRIDLPSGTPAELVVPDTTPRRGLVVLPDIYGLRPLFDDLVASLARERQWAVCAVEPFPGVELPTVDDRFVALSQLDDKELLRDAVDAAEVVAGHSNADRIAILGFCMGGMYSLKAVTTARFDRAVAFYGMIRVPLTWRGPGQGEPLDAVTSAPTTPVLAVIGERDPFTPPEDVAALRHCGPHVTVVAYPEADHGFAHDPDREAHRPGDAADAWSRVFAFLA